MCGKISTKALGLLSKKTGATVSELIRRAIDGIPEKTAVRTNGRAGADITDTAPNPATHWRCHVAVRILSYSANQSKLARISQTEGKPHRAAFSAHRPVPYYKLQSRTGFAPIVPMIPMAFVWRAGWRRCWIDRETSRSSSPSPRKEENTCPAGGNLLASCALTAARNTQSQPTGSR